MSDLKSNFAKVRARQILKNVGLENQALERVSSTRNEVFLSKDYVIRTNKRSDQRLKRETEVYRLLPNESWAPEIITYGTNNTNDYLICKRKPGASLARHWPQMQPQQRRRAITQIVAICKQIHAIDGDIPPLASSPHLLDFTNYSIVQPALEMLEKVSPFYDLHFLDDIRQKIDALYSIITFEKQLHLIHGDLTFENILWDGSNISAVVDFEWARAAPLDLEIDVLFRYYGLPEAHAPAEHQHSVKPQDYYAVPLWLMEDYPALFEVDKLTERLVLYALCFEVNELHHWQNADLKNPLHPHGRLKLLLGTGGYLEKTLHALRINWL